MAFITDLPRKRKLIIACCMVLIISVIDLFSGVMTGKIYRGRHWVWESSRFGPWISFPPLRIGLRQEWSDFSGNVPPPFMPDDCWERQCWHQLHELSSLDKKGKEGPFSDEDIDELAKLANYRDEWYVRSKAILVMWEAKKEGDSDQRARLVGIIRERLKSEGH